MGDRWASLRMPVGSAVDLLIEHDNEHYDLAADDPRVVACVFCTGGDDA